VGGRFGVVQTKGAPRVDGASDPTAEEPAPPPEDDARGNGARGRREEIFEAAARMFNQKGYAATSIQDVADAVGILKGSLYYYIDSKEDLLFQIIEDVHQVSINRLEQLRSLEGSALVRLRAVIEGHVLNNARNVVKTGVFFSDFRSLSEERRARIVAERDLYDAFVRELIRQGQEEGVIYADVDPKLTAMAVLGMMNWLYQWYRPDGERSPEEIAREMANLVLAGISCEPDDAGRDRGAVGTR
jgi:AcrR family transcriptional regulator